jgi:D-proline reductase (dithiol) PrdB
MGLKDIVPNPNTAAFSRIKYLPRIGTEEQLEEFVKGLVLASINAKYEDNWDGLRGYLEDWEEISIGLQFSGLAIPDAGSIPWAEFNKPLNESKFALVTTGGVSVTGQTPYSERDDISYRQIPGNFSKDEYTIWHPGYDHGPAEQDINCIFPIDRFRELEAEGIIGCVADTHYSFMGLIHSTDGLMTESAPEVARKLKEDGVDAVFLAST